MLGKIEDRRRRGIAEDGMASLTHGHVFQQTLEVGDGQGSLVCCSPWGLRVRHNSVTELN